MLKALWSKPVLAAAIIVLPGALGYECRPMILTAWPACSGPLVVKQKTAGFNLPFPALAQ